MKFLLIDDEEQILDGLEMIIEDIFEEAEFTKLESAEQALDLAFTEAYQAICCDLHMPGMNGDEFIQKLRSEDGPNKAQPIFVISAFVPKDSPLHSIENLHFIDKPFNLDKIENDLREVLL